MKRGANVACEADDSAATSHLHLVTTTPKTDVIPSEVEGSQHFAHRATEPTGSPLVLWHLLSLDAPTVAALWTWFFATSTGVALPWQSPAAMFLAVWMLYVADRLLDARPTLGDAELEERHHFHRRHRTAFLAGIPLAALFLATLLHALSAATLHLYILLATLLGAWLLLIHARPLPGVESNRLPKEIAVGLFFSAAVCIPTVAAAPQLRSFLLAPALCFAAVCTLNCLFVYAWEHPTPQRAMHSTTRWATKHLPALSTTTGAACCTAALLLPHGLIYPLQACTFSAAALLLLHSRRNRIASTRLRALADFCLLTPLLTLPFFSHTR